MARYHKISYRRCEFTGSREEVPTLESELRGALQGEKYSSHYGDRIFAVSDAQKKSVINYQDSEPPGVFVEILQIDARRELTFLEHSEIRVPVAEVKHREVPGNEDHLGSPAYFYVLNNHMAILESVGLSGPHIQNYINALLAGDGRLGVAENWKLAPKIEVAEGEIGLSQGVSQLEVKPLARLIGDAASAIDKPRSKQSARSTADREERTARGPKVFDLFRTLGASDAELGDLRSRLSTDLGLEARVIFTVRQDRRGTPATLAPNDISQAVASLEEENAVTIVSPDGRQRGRLVSLSDRFEIEDDGGLLSLGSAAKALARALAGWAEKGRIDLKQED
jgi:hypothetical protein